MIKLLLGVLFLSSLCTAGEWLQWSGDLHNHHNLTPANPKLSLENVNKLDVLWEFKSKNSVVATPTVKDGLIYFTDIAKANLLGIFSTGRLYAVDAKTGQKVWSNKISDYNKVGVRNFSRSSPAIAGDLLIIGDSLNNTKFIVKALTSFKNIPGTSLMAINRHTGKLVWRTIIDSHFASRTTMSPIVYGQQIFVGVSSIESEIPAIRKASYPCCTFKGSLVSLDLATGRILWKTPMIDPGLEHAGAPVWGNSPPIDVKRGRIYIGTGNNYQATTEMRQCMLNAQSQPDYVEAKAILDCGMKTDVATNRFDSIVALDFKTGRIIWTRKTMYYDAWNVGCGSSFSSFPAPNKACPKPQGIDADFGQAPMFIQTGKGDLVVAGQKNGRFWALNAEDGSVAWLHQIGPRGKLGGHQWGSATDGKRIYFQVTNMEHEEITLSVGLYKGLTVRSGYWGALSVDTGEVLWETPDPDYIYPLKGEGLSHIVFGSDLGRGYFAAPMGPITYYNKMLFAGSMSQKFYALNAQTGEIIWSKSVKGSVGSAPSIVDDVLYWGTGYHLGFAGNSVYALSLKP